MSEVRFTIRHWQSELIFFYKIVNDLLPECSIHLCSKKKKNALLKDFVLDEMGFVLEESFLEKRNASTNRASQVVSHLLS